MNKDPLLSPIYLPPVEKGKADYRTYRPLNIPSKDGESGITILLANDPQSTQFGASVSVHSGASSDPRVLPGLAHFCEHMCFLGSSPYPQENQYKQYLAQHGGKSNASTSMSHTTYQFDVLADHAEKALDIFSNFFISPLFTTSGTGREIHAVDSENSKNLVNDGRRRWQVLKSLGDDNHHFSKFSTGNRFTLPVSAHEGRSSGNVNDEKSWVSSSNESSSFGISSHDGVPKTNAHPLLEMLNKTDDCFEESDLSEFVRIALLAFHKQHYRPRNMTVVIVGPQSLDTLESWVVPRFSYIPDRAGDDDEEILVLEGTADEMKSHKMKKIAKRLIEEAACEAPPISSLEAKYVKYNPAFRPELQGGAWPVVVTTKPLQSLRKLVLYFPIPPTWDNPDRSPTRMLSHLFGHEGRGSPFALLQDAGWLSSLSCGSRVSSPDQKLFQIDTNLTSEGEENWEEVAKVIFAYARMLGKAADNSLAGDEGNVCNEAASDRKTLQRIWNEIGQIERIHFHQTSPGNVYSFASSVAQSISKYGTTICLSAGSMLHESPVTLPAEDLSSFCQCIIPENCFIERCSQKAWEEQAAVNSGKENKAEHGSTFSFGKKTEKWFGIDYYISPIMDTDIHSWKTTNDKSLHLPDQNLFIPRSLDLCSDLPEEARSPRLDKPIDPPKLIVNDSKTGRLWWRLDDRYALPKASLTLLIRTATSEHTFLETAIGTGAYSLCWIYSSEVSMRSNFLLGIFSDAMVQDTYDARLAGLEWSLSKSSSGFTLSCYGYSDRLSDLGVKLLSSFVDNNFINESHFRTNADKSIRGLKSYFESRRADSIALYYRNLIMNWRGGGMERSLELAEAITIKDVVDHHDFIWKDKGMELECLYSGNVSETEARSFFDKAAEILAAPSKCSEPLFESKHSWIPGPFERRIPTDDIELHFQSKNEKEENGAVIVTYQNQTPGFKSKNLSSDQSLQQSAAIRLLCTMIKEPFFNDLRTKQQLGYIVSSYYDINFTSCQYNFLDSIPGPHSSSLRLPLFTPVDSVVLYVLSRKETPSEVTHRIDDFIYNFRSRLEEMPSSEIQGFGRSLAKSLTKPIRKLSEEATFHFTKICRYAPEVMAVKSIYSVEDLGWDNPQVMASAVQNLDRRSLLQAFDNLIGTKGSRSRVVSTVYGKTHPMHILDKCDSLIYVTSLEHLLKKRSTLIPYDPATNYMKELNFIDSLFQSVGIHKTAVKFAAAAAVLGASVWAISATRNSHCDKKSIKML